MTAPIPEGGPVLTEQSRAGMEVVGDEQGEGDFDGAEGEVEQPGHDEQGEQVRLSAQDAEPSPCVACCRNGDRKGGQAGPADLKGEHGEGGGVQADDPCRGHHSHEQARKGGACDGRAPLTGAERTIGRHALVVAEQGDEDGVLAGLAPGVEQRRRAQEPDVHARGEHAGHIRERNRPQQHGPEPGVDDQKPLRRQPPHPPAQDECSQGAGKDLGGDSDPDERALAALRPQRERHPSDGDDRHAITQVGQREGRHQPPKRPVGEQRSIAAGHPAPRSC